MSNKFIAARSGNEERLKEILNNDGMNAYINDKETQTGNTVFYCAVVGGNVACGEMILLRGGDPNIVANDGSTAIDKIATLGNIDFARMALKLPKTKPDFTKFRVKGFSALHLAAKEGHYEVCQEFITNGRADVNITDSDGNTPLHLAARNGHDKCVSVLIENGANINSKTRIGNTPLHDAAKAGRAISSHLLLEAKADTSIRNADGLTPIEILDKYNTKNHLDTAEVFLLHAASKTTQSITSN